MLKQKLYEDNRFQIKKIKQKKTMKKMILSLMAVLMGTMSMQAQDDLVATLSHGSTLSTFTGEDAFAQAYNAAADGDVITLSPGVFVGFDMNKAITVRGAGYKPMASNGYTSTQITGEVTVDVPTEGTATFEMEGIDFLNGVSFQSDKMRPLIVSKSKFRNTVYGFGINMKATHCEFQELRATNENNNGIYCNTTLNCQSCVIATAISHGLVNDKVGKITATNCIVGYSYGLPYSTLINCVLTPNNGYYLDGTTTALNCVGIYPQGGGKKIFEYIVDPSNVMIEGEGETAYAKIFKTLKNLGSASLNETFELTDAAKTTYLGDDGTQVGIYGGTAPFTLESTNPQVTKFVVSSTTEGGQLRVKINVE